MSVILYLLASLPSNIMSFKLNEISENEVNENSLLVAFSKKFSYIFEPIGIDTENWPATVSLLTGVVAKEVVVANLITLYQIKENSDVDTRELVKKYYHHDTNAFAYLLFVLIYFPCITVFSVMKKEASTKVAVYSSIFYTVFAYIIAAAFYKISFYTNHSIVFSMLILIILLSFIAYVLRSILSLKNPPIKPL
jgi:ferrous iron transport protein B